MEFKLRKIRPNNPGGGSQGSYDTVIYLTSSDINSISFNSEVLGIESAELAAEWGAGNCTINLQYPDTEYINQVGCAHSELPNYFTGNLGTLSNGNAVLFNAPGAEGNPGILMHSYAWIADGICITYNDLITGSLLSINDIQAIADAIRIEFKTAEPITYDLTLTPKQSPVSSISFSTERLGISNAEILADTPEMLNVKLEYANSEKIDQIVYTSMNLMPSDGTQTLGALSDGTNVVYVYDEYEQGYLYYLTRNGFNVMYADTNSNALLSIYDLQYKLDSMHVELR